jgi:hypothetical protein
MAKKFKLTNKGMIALSESVKARSKREADRASNKHVVALGELNRAYDARAICMTPLAVNLVAEPKPPVENKLDFSGQVGREKADIMATIVQNKNINEYVLSFFKKVCEDDDILETFTFAWQQENVQVEVAAVLAKTKKSIKKTKDPNKPKRGKSAYLFFCAANRAAAQTAVQKRLGYSAKATEVTKELGARWTLLKDSKKATDKKMLKGFEDEAAADKALYDEAMQGYEAPSDDELEAIVVEKKKAKKSEKDPNKPKRGKSAYIFFCADKRAEVKEELGDGAKATEVTSRLGELWNEFKNDEDREDEMKVYTDLAAEDKARYLAEMEDYVPDEEVKKPAVKVAPKEPEEPEEPEVEPEEPEEEVKVEKKRSKGGKGLGDGKKKSAKKSTGRKMSGYTFYCKELRETAKNENPDMKAAEVTKLLANRWKDLDAAEKKQWKEDALNHESHLY